MTITRHRRDKVTLTLRVSDRARRRSATVDRFCGDASLPDAWHVFGTDASYRPEREVVSVTAWPTEAAALEAAEQWVADPSSIHTRARHD